MLCGIPWVASSGALFFKLTDIYERYPQLPRPRRFLGMVIGLGCLKRASRELNDARFDLDLRNALRYWVVSLAAFWLMFGAFVFDFVRNVFLKG